MTLHRLLTAIASDPALVDDDRRWSSAELDRWAARLAAGLLDGGVQRGQPVVFQYGVEATAVAMYRAIWRIGAVAVPVHHQDGGAVIGPLMAQLRATGATPMAVSRPDLALADWPGSTSADDLLRGDEAPPVDCDPHDRALVVFTSGSSGIPKGVVHTHGSLAHKPPQLIDLHHLGPTSASLMPAPLAHVSGLLHAVLCPAIGGFKTVLMARWDPAEALDLIERERITYMVGPPTFFLGLMDDPTFASARVASLELLSVGGTSITPEFVDRAERELGCVVKRAYGSTEAPSFCTSDNHDSPAHRTRTDGRSVPPGEIRIDSDSGEVLLRGPELASGYLDPEMDDGVFVDGWYRTGDTGTVDDDGWLTITGRLAATIIRGGENISITAVEATLQSHPAVTAAVVLGRPDERLGETVVAFVTTTGSFDLDDCRRWFDESGAARFTCPETVVVLDEIPLLPFGKPDRQAVADVLESIEE